MSRRNQKNAQENDAADESRRYITGAAVPLGVIESRGVALSRRPPQLPCGPSPPSPSVSQANRHYVVPCCLLSCKPANLLEIIERIFSLIPSGPASLQAVVYDQFLDFVIPLPDTERAPAPATVTSARDSLARCELFSCLFYFVLLFYLKDTNESVHRRIAVNVIKPDQSGTDDIISLDVASDMTLEILKAVIESDSNIPPAAQTLVYNNQLLSNDAQTLEQVGIVDGGVLSVHVVVPGGQRQANPRTALGGPSSAGQQQAMQRTRPPPQQPFDTETARLHLLGNPNAMETLRQQNPELVAAAEDSRRFQEVFLAQKRREQDLEREKAAQIAALNADPFNVDAQKEIEEIIRQQAVTENLQAAMEHNPECR